MDNITIFDLPYTYREPLYLDKGGLTVELYPCPTVKTIIDAVQWSLDMIVTEMPIVSSPVKTVFADLGLLKAFTNLEIDFTKKTADDIYAAYDAIKQSDLIEDIKAKGDKGMVNFFFNSLNQTLTSIVQYRQSVAGVIDTIVGSANQNIEIMDKAQAIMEDPKALENVKNLLLTAKELQSPPAQQ